MANKPKTVPNKPKVVVLCGSTRFVDLMAVVAWWIERDEGAITMGTHLLPPWYSDDLQDHHQAEHEGVKEKMDALHLAKIDRADEVFIVNFDGYVGESTQAEIAHAIQRNLLIRWLDPTKATNAVLVHDHSTTYLDRIVARQRRLKRRAKIERQG